MFEFQQDQQDEDNSDDELDEALTSASEGEVVGEEVLQSHGGVSGRTSSAGCGMEKEAAGGSDSRLMIA